MVSLIPGFYMSPLPFWATIARKICGLREKLDDPDSELTR